MKIHRLGLGLFLGLLIGTSIDARASQDGLHRIGIRADGAEIDEVIDTETYAKELRAIVGSVSDSSLAVLNRENRRNPWKLETLVVGIGLGMEFGVGPVLKLKATPRLRCAFSRSSDPVLP